MGGLMNSTQANTQQNTAQNQNTNSATVYGSNTANNTAQNTANNTLTQSATGPSQAAQSFLNTINPNQTISNINAFQSPYIPQVLNAQQALEANQAGIAQAQLLGNMGSVGGGLGGDRGAIAQAALAGQLQLANNATNAGILQQGYNTAANLATTQGQQALGAAGLAGTQASSGIQQQGNMLGTAAGSTLGGANTAQSTAGAGTGSGSTTQSTIPGFGTIAGLAGGLLARDGGAIGYADGGPAYSSPALSPDYIRYEPSHFDYGGSVTAPGWGGDPNDPNSFAYISQLIQKALLQKPQQGQTPQPAQAQNSNSLMGQFNGPNSLSAQFNSGADLGAKLGDLGDSLGSSLGLAKGGQANTQAGGAPAATPPIANDPGPNPAPAPSGPPTTPSGLPPGNSYYSPVGFSPMQAAAPYTPPTSAQYYTPVSMPPLQAQAPSVGAPNISAPSLPMPTVPQAYVPFPNVPRASSGKGSGGAVDIRLKTGGEVGSRAKKGESAPRKLAPGGASDDSADSGGSWWPSMTDVANNLPGLSYALGQAAPAQPAQTQQPQAAAPPAQGQGPATAAPATGPQPAATRQFNLQEDQNGPNANKPSLVQLTPETKRMLHALQQAHAGAGLPVPGRTNGSIAGGPPQQPGPIDQPTVVHSETYTPDGRRVDTPAALASPKPIQDRLSTGIADITKAYQLESPRGVANVNYQDTHGMPSTGTYGIYGDEAVRFARAYPQFGLPPVSDRRFGDRWAELAQNPQTAYALQAAELEWHTKEIDAKVVPSLRAAHVPENIVQDPHVQSYIADRMTQHGPGSNENLPRGPQYGDRIRQAVAASNGDPAKFLTSLSALDKQAIGGDFGPYLSEHPDHVRGLENRVDNRLNAALGRPVTSSGNGQGGQGSQGSVTQQPQSWVERTLASLNNRGSDNGQQHIINGPIGNAGRGILGAMGLNADQKAMEKFSRLMAGVGQGKLFEATSQEPKLAMEVQKMMRELAMPVHAGSMVIKDDYGVPHVVPLYQTYDPKSGKFIDAPAATQIQQQGAGKGYAALPEIPTELQGDAFVKAARDAGINGNDLELAGKVADYQYDPTKLLSLKEMERRRIVQLAGRINPEYDMRNYKNVAETESKLAGGYVAKSIASIGRLFDEVEQASELADRTHNSRWETFNAASGKVYPSGSEYQKARSALATMLNNTVDTASLVARGGGQSAEGDAKRRAASMNVDMAPETLKAALATEAEVGLKNGQSNLTAYNDAHGYKPDNPKYKTIMDRMTDRQRRRAIQLLGVKKIEDIIGGRHIVPHVQSEDEARALVASGKLKSGDKFFDDGLDKELTVK